MKTKRKLFAETEFTGRKVWEGSKIIYYYRKGFYHREDGPAIIYPGGSTYYYLNGKQMTDQEYVLCRLNDLLL